MFDTENFPEELIIAFQCRQKEPKISEERASASDDPGNLLQQGETQATMLFFFPGTHTHIHIYNAHIYYANCVCVCLHFIIFDRTQLCPCLTRDVIRE